MRYHLELAWTFGYSIDIHLVHLSLENPWCYRRRKRLFYLILLFQSKAYLPKISMMKADEMTMTENKSSMNSIQGYRILRWRSYFNFDCLYLDDRYLNIPSMAHSMATVYQYRPNSRAVDWKVFILSSFMIGGILWDWYLSWRAQSPITL